MNFASHSPDHPDNEGLLEFVRRVIGNDIQVEDRSRDFGRPSIVWRITDRSGSRVWMKQHEGRLLYERELLGLECFVTALGRQTWWSSPSLIAKDDELPAMLLSDVEGEALDSTPASGDERITMFKMAGRFARMLHGVDTGPPEDGMSGDEYFLDRMEHYLRAGEEHVGPSDVELAYSLISECCAEGGIERVPCHMDYSPRNWLIQRGEMGTGFGVIDWERARQDAWLQDVQRMEFDDFHDEPHLREAYFEGYGRSPTASEERVLITICLVNAIATVPWAVAHNDPAFAALGREQIRRIRARVG